MWYLAICLASFCMMIINNIIYEKYKRDNNYMNVSGKSNLVIFLRDAPVLTLLVMLIGAMLPPFNLEPFFSFLDRRNYYADMLEKQIKKGEVYYNNQEEINVDNVIVDSEVLVGEVVDNQESANNFDKMFETGENIEPEDLFVEYLSSVLDSLLNAMESDIKVTPESPEGDIIDVETYKISEVVEDEKVGPRL